MVDCPTGAIGRDPGGEVFIRDALCTGCGACAKSCPWDNIQMAPRPALAARPAGAAAEYADVAVKCDLCRAYESPACVTACPTASIFRLNPAEEIADVRDLLRGAPGVPAAAQARARPPVVLGAAIAAAGIGIAGAVLVARGYLQPGRGAGLGAGLLAGVGMVLLMGYAVPKRLVRRWMRPRAKGAAPRKAASLVRPQLEAHLAIGMATVGLAFAHAPLRGGGGSGAALALALLGTSLVGGLAGLAYRVVPARLARLERTAALPEDFVRARQELLDRLYREASGKSDLVKKLLEKILLPYARSPLGPLALVASGRGLRAEEAALRARIDVVLEGRGRERLAGLAELCRIVVELRALPAQRWLLGALRAPLPVHVVTFGIAMALLGVHVALAVWRRG
jgi:ferredoxin